MSQGDYLRDRYKKEEPALPRRDYSVPPRPPAQVSELVQPVDAVEPKELLEEPIDVAEVPVEPQEEVFEEPILELETADIEPQPEHTEAIQSPASASAAKKVTATVLVLLIIGLAAVVGIVSYNKFKPGLASDTTSTLSKASAQASVPAQIKPNFNLYYPSSLPVGFFVDRGSVKLKTDLFVFNILQGNKTYYYVSEQPIDKNFSFDNFKKGLKSPTDQTTTLGQSVYGGLNAGVITGLKTSDNTFIIVNCIDQNCAAPSKALLESMLIVRDPSKL